MHEAKRYLDQIDYQSLNKDQEQLYTEALNQFVNQITSERPDVLDSRHSITNQLRLTDAAIKRKGIPDNTRQKLCEYWEDIAERAVEYTFEAVEESLEEGKGDINSYSVFWEDLQKIEPYIELTDYDEDDLNSKKRELAQEAQETVTEEAYALLDILADTTLGELEELRNKPVDPKKRKDVPRELANFAESYIQKLEDFVEVLDLEDIENSDSYDQETMRSRIDEANRNLAKIVEDEPLHVLETAQSIQMLSLRTGYHSEATELIMERAEEVQPVRRHIDAAEGNLEKAKDRKRTDRGVEEAEDSPDNVSMARLNLGPNELMESARESLDTAEEIMSEEEFQSDKLEREIDGIREELREEFRNPE